MNGLAAFAVAVVVVFSVVVGLLVLLPRMERDLVQDADGPPAGAGGPSTERVP